MTDVADEINQLHEIDGDGFWSTIYSSPFNQRIQVLSYGGSDLCEMTGTLRDRALAAGFGKVFVKARECDREAFEDAGMSAEATISGYFSGEDAIVVSLFLDDERREQPFAEDEAGILDAIRARPADPSVPELPEGYIMKPGSSGDAAEIAALYGEVFASYPFPITEEAYIRSTMKDQVAYRCVRDRNGHVVAAASAEMNTTLQNAEMTDFATLPSQRGLGLAQHLLAALETDMVDRGVTNLYTIARARSAGMNRVFYNRGYEFTGTLVNNCHIAGRFENMHVWCRDVA